MRHFGFCLLLAAFGLNAFAAETNSIVWHKATDRVDVDVHSLNLSQLLEQITARTGWRVYIEPGTTHTTSAKFTNLPSGQALQRLFGDLNYALVPQTNAAPHLYVFTTKMGNATQLVRVPGAGKAKHVPNELLVKLKPGVDPDAFAKMYGAKIIGRMDKLGIYLLEFANAAATDAALAELQNNPDVAAVDYNYYFDPEPSAQSLVASSALPAPVSLTPDPPSQNDPCNVIIGLIDTDTPVQSLGPSLEQFLMTPISVVNHSSTGGATAAQSLGTPVAVNSSGLFSPEADSSATTAVPTHGTSMAETILRAVAQASGGSSSARILPVDVYGTSDTTTTWYVALGIQAAVNKGANVLNLSLGSSGDSTVLDSVIQQAMADGVLIFAAAGNTPVNTPTYPAAIPGVNAVTALQQKGQIASYANYGSFVDMALPGASVVYLNGQPYLVQGTSVSTAYATGVAAGTKTSSCAGWSQIQTAMQQKFPMPTQ